MAGHTGTIAALKVHTLEHHEGGALAWWAPNAFDFVKREYAQTSKTLGFGTGRRSRPSRIRAVDCLRTCYQSSELHQ